MRNADLEDVHMRKQLLLSTGIICLMLAPAVSYGQAPSARGEEQKQMRPADTGKGGASQERGAERAQERGQAAEQKGAAGREERGAGSRQSEERGKASSERPATAADDKRGRGEDAKSTERAQDSRQDSHHGSRDQTAREGKDAKDSAKDSKGSAEMKRDSDREKSRAESDKSKEGKEGTTAAQKEREGTGTTQKDAGRDQRDSSKNAAEQGKDMSKDAKQPSTATDTTRQQPSTNAQTAPAGSTNQTTQSQSTQSQTNQTQVSQQSNLSTDKQVRISQTLTRERLAEPERNLSISIRVGERVPDRVRFHRLPDTIVSIEPEYRGYDYFTTEEEIVIVEPRTHRIVSQIPRDASRIHAAGGAGGTGSTTGTAGYTGTTAAAGGASPCRIMRRDTAGNVTELTPQTVGAAAQQQSISVTVQVPGGATTPPIAMGSPDGQIVVSGQSGADCTVTIEAQTR
ncbi:DUF1236 domain-containing protein [Bradyrhizobium sp. BWA-3-5]|uniref:DUF1236 domain-containing protein n=1 Tax=Bradyrhizobium sp. BWA-3-5 TaxID=3080013 RepID=UPI00293ED770|nr:DUF1236 domain-containing protein [Bradyrhizobium sp. BWA-3-5]WOH65292.1 DUF1236 domain-containing protein [Bradyrhizobium sp. BWA-3-5]